MDIIQNPGKIAAKQSTAIPHQEIHLVCNQLVFSVQVTNTIANQAIILSTGTSNVAAFQEER